MGMGMGSWLGWAGLGWDILGMGTEARAQREAREVWYSHLYANVRYAAV